VRLSKEQLTVVVLAVVLAVSAAAITPGMVFDTSDPAPAKSGTVYYTSDDPAATTTGGEYTASEMREVPGDYASSERADTPPPPNVSSSAGAQTMRVTVTEQDGEVALELADGRVHDGRWVSIPSEWFQEELGRVPSVAYINHESGREYHSQTHVQNGDVAFYVDSFSTNTVSFSGRVEVTGDFTDGSKVEYGINDLDDASDVTVNLTGVTITENESILDESLSDGDSVSVDVAGMEATNVAVTATGGSKESVKTQDSGDLLTDNDPLASFESVDVTIENPEGESATEMPFTVSINGTKVHEENIYLESGSTTTETINGSWEAVDNVTAEYDDSTVNVLEVRSYTEGSEGVDVTVDGNTHEFGNLTAGESETWNTSLEPGKYSFEWAATGGIIDSAINYTESTKTVDPSIELNKESVSHTGTLSDSETVSKTIDQSVLKEGTNNLNISVGDGTLSSDAPTPTVAINVTHDSTDKQSVTYDGGQWAESYNVSDTYASSRSEANLSVPFQSDVYAIQSLEAQVNTSGWTPVVASNYTLENTTLSVDLNAVYGSDIPAGTTMHVRTTGVAVEAINGSITVTSVTPPGETLNSSVTLDTWNASSKLDVSSTQKGDRVHYITSESWNNEDAYSRYQSTGTQRLHLDAATGGDTFSVHTLPVTIRPEAGDVNIRVPDDRVNRTQPVYKATPGQSTSDAYDITFLNATDGETYVLWSETHGIVLDEGTASSPLTLTDDEDNTELNQFQIDTGTSSSSGSGGSSGAGGSGIVGVPTTGGDTNFIPLIGVAVLGALVLVAARNDGAVADAGQDAASGIESRLSQVPVVGPVVGKTMGGIVEGVTQLAEGVAGNQTVAISIITALIIGSVQGGIIEVPQSSLTLIVVAGIGIYSLVALREFGEFTSARWAGILAATTIVTLQTMSEQSFLTAIVESRVWPILALAVVYLAYQAVQGFQQPDNPTNVVVDARTGEGGGDDG
jgi:hypothetical protein